MKKGLCIIIALMVLLSGFALAEHEGHSHTSADRPCIAAGTEGLWYAQGNELSWIPTGMASGESALTVDGEILGLAGTDAGAYLAIRAGGNTAIYLYLMKDASLTRQFDIEQGDIRAMAAMQSGLAVLYAPQYPASFEVDGRLFFYTYTGETQPQRINRAVNLSKVDNQTLLAVTKGDHAYQLDRLDLSSGSYETVMEGYLLAAVPLPDEAYGYATDTRLFRFDAAGENMQIARVEANDVEPPVLALVGDCLYMLDCYGLRVLHTPDIGDTAGADQLILVNCLDIEDFRLMEAIKRFEEDTGILIQMSEMDDQQLLTSLIAGESEIDILFVDANTLPAYEAAHVLTGLSGYEQIQQSLTSWMNVLGAATIGSELMCVPAFVSASWLFMDDSLVPYFGAELPDECTWTELFALAGQFQADTDGNGSQDAYFLIDNLYYPEFLYQLVSANSQTDIDFADAAFVKPMTAYKELVKQGLVGDAFGDGDMGGLFHANTALDISTTPFLVMPTLEDGSRIVPGYVHGMAISAFSPKKDLAADFLALYADVDVQLPPEGFGFIANIDLYPEAANLTASEKQQVIASMAHYALVSPAWINADFSSYAMEVIEQYVSDQLTLEDLVKQLNQKMEMIRNG